MQSSGMRQFLQSHHFVSGEDLAQTLYRYVLLYNQQLPQSTLGSKTPLDAMKRWYASHPHLFVKRPCNLAGGDMLNQNGRLIYLIYLIFSLVPSARLELAQLSPLPPQDSVSTSSTTTARQAVGL